MTLAEFNSLTSPEAARLLLDCCGCDAWAARVCAQRPFTSVAAVQEAADRECDRMTREDWLEAFSHHPQIGEKAATGSESHRQWSAGEQKSVGSATDDVKERLARGNRAYREKFGYIYLICATGQSADEMLALLEQRLQNEAADEVSIAAEQQRQIMRLRIQKLFAGEQNS